MNGERWKKMKNIYSYDSSLFYAAVEEEVLGNYESATKDVKFLTSFYNYVAFLKQLSIRKNTSPLQIACIAAHFGLRLGLRLKEMDEKVIEQRKVIYGNGSKA